MLTQSLSVCLSVCLFVCEQDISKSYGLIQTKLSGLVGCVTRTNRLNFSEDPVARVFNIFKVILHH